MPDPIHCKCAACGHEMDVPANLDGMTFKCRRCKAPFTVSRPTTKTCPFCAEDIHVAAVKCKHCGSMLDGSQRQGGSGQAVIIAGIDPTAELRTPIAGKSKGKVTGLGSAGIVIGVVFSVICVAAVLTDVGATGAMAENAIFGVLFGVGFALASFLWARR